MDYSMLNPKACKFSCWKRSKKKETQAAPPAPPPPQPPAPPPPPPHHDVGHPQGPGPQMGRYMDDFERLARHPRFGYIEHTRTWRLGFDTGYGDDYFYNNRHANGPHPSVYRGPPGPPPRREYGSAGGYHSSPPLAPQIDFYGHGPPPSGYRGPPGPPPHREFGMRPYRLSPPDPYYYPESPPPGAHYYPPAPYYGHDENPNECSTM